MRKDHLTAGTEEFLDTTVGGDLYTDMHVIAKAAAAVKPDKMKKGLENEFRVFQDYLGLINIIQPEGSPPPVESPSSDSSSLQSFDGLFDVAPFQDFSSLRCRMNSFDSDKSESSSLDSRSEGDMFEVLKPAGKDCRARDIIHGTSAASSLGEIGQPLLRRPLDNRRSAASKPRRMPNFGNGVYQDQPSSSRQSVNGSNQRNVCVFCRNNGESREFYTSHSLKNAEGKTTCPILRAYTCPLCKANGDDSHTIKYCPRYTPKPKDNLMTM